MLGLKDGNKPGRGSIPRSATIIKLLTKPHEYD